MFQTLVMAFEKKIESIREEPTWIKSQRVYYKNAESSIDDIIKDHFKFLIQIELRTQIKKEFKDYEN